MKDKDNCIYIDVDETLIRHCEHDEEPHISFLFDKEMKNRIVNKVLVEKIKKWTKSKYLIVWTSNSAGHEWAESVLKALEIRDCIDVVLYKPSKMIDDSPFHEWAHINLEKPNDF